MGGAGPPVEAVRCRWAVLDVLQSIFSPGLWARGASVGKGAERGCDMSEEVAASGGVPPREGGEPMALQS